MTTTIYTGAPGCGKSTWLRQLYDANTGQSRAMILVESRTQPGLVRDRREFYLRTYVNDTEHEHGLFAEEVGASVVRADADATGVILGRYRVSRAAAAVYLDFLRDHGGAQQLYFDELAPMQFAVVPELGPALRVVLAHRLAAGLPTTLTARLLPWVGAGNEFTQQLKTESLVVHCQFPTADG